MSSVTTENGLLQAIQKAAKQVETGEVQKVAETKKEVSHEVAYGNTEKIILPHNMSKLDGAAELYKQHEDEETEIKLVQLFEDWDENDTLVAAMRTMKRLLGYSPGVAQNTFFGKRLPVEVNVPIGYMNGIMQYEPCFIGKFVVAQWDNAQGTVGFSENGAFVAFDVKKKFASRGREFFAAINQELSERSIFKGKSIMAYPKFDPESDSTKLAFEFIENNGAPHIILNGSEERTLRELVINPLGKTGKRCILFTGGYGTGKTETAMRVGKEATEKGITFMYCRDANWFSQLLDKAKRYGPALVFLEDIDEIGSGEERDHHMNNILNKLDGVETKGSPLTVIFTTNNEQRINTGLRRPGRIDIVLRFKKCDKVTIHAIYERMLADLKGASELDYRMLAEATPEVQGALVAEIAKRVRDIVAFDDQILTNDIVLAAITSIMDHIEFMEAKPEHMIDPRIQAVTTLAMEFDRVSNDADVPWSN